MSEFMQDEINALGEEQPKRKPTMGHLESNWKKYLGGFIVLLLAYSASYSVPEGHRGIVLRFGKAISQEMPGIHMKWPFIESVQHIDVRPRKYRIQMTAATTSKGEDGAAELEMPSTVIVSANWQVPANSALDIYIQYGSLEQYEDRILDPRVIRSVKQSFPKYTIEEVVATRERVRSDIESALQDALAGKLATMTDINIEDISWAQQIRNAVTKKQTAKLEYEAEADKLAKQNLEAQRDVNTQKATAEGIKAVSIETADKIEREGLAEAAALEAKAKVLRDNPRLIELIKAERWNGEWPHVYGGGDGVGLLLNMDGSKK